LNFHLDCCAVWQRECARGTHERGS
jgi:hypothetical protein